MSSNKYFSFDDDNLYLVEDAIINFREYIGMSFEEFSLLLEHSLMFKSKFNKEDILKRATLSGISLDDLNIISSSYDVMFKIFNILQKKILIYQNLLIYLTNSSKKEQQIDFELEGMLKKLNMPHCGSVMRGIDINELLRSIKISVVKLRSVMNDMESFSRNFKPYTDYFSLYYGIHRLYPYEDIVLDDDDIYDDTSIRPNSRHLGYKPPRYHKYVNYK